MAICAADNALGDFDIDLIEWSALTNECGHGRSLLATDVIELQHDRGALSTIDAAMRFQISPNVLAGPQDVASSASTAPGFIKRFVLLIVQTTVACAASATIRVESPARGISSPVLIERQGALASWAFSHCN